MDSISTWSSLFNHSSFFCLKKGEEMHVALKDLLSRLDSQKVDHFHPNRKNEFLLGRLCACLAHQRHFGTELLVLPFSSDRSPLWPQNIIGSISHNRSWVGAAVAESKLLLGVGVDFELMGRAKGELGRYIRSSKDLQGHPFFNENELLTLIFSAKESLYKALYPTVQRFFGFETAAVREIDHLAGTFKIDLVSEISPSFGPAGRHRFEGRFKIVGETCLTVLEIPH